jgi:hypothetical protein
MRGAQLNGGKGKKDGYSLTADWIKVGGNVFLDSANAAGTIWLAGADISGQLVMFGAQLNGGQKGGNSLTADEIKVGRDVFLDSANAAGTISFASADISGQLAMSGAQLNGGQKGGNSLTANGIKVGNSVYLNVFAGEDKRSFMAKSTVSLRNAHVGGSLDLTGAVFLADEKASALDAERMQITRVLVWLPAQSVRGSVNLEGATAGGRQSHSGVMSGPATRR